MKHILLITICLVFLSVAACSTTHHFQYQTSKEIIDLLQTRPEYPDARFVVLADPHLYDKSLGTTGKAYQDYLNKDRKLLALSEEIYREAIDKVSKENADFVLVAGDLTKDGEKICHQGVANGLRQLEAAGTKVYVVPGNHDINNGESVQYVGDDTKPVPNVNDQEFKSLYADFGYKEAIGQDSNSLSYVSEPVDGLWVLALDSVRWKENNPGHHAITGGAFSSQTLDWIEDQLMLAKKKNKAVIAFLHHGIMEHYPANEKFYAKYIVDDHEIVSSLFAAYGVRLVFTGHFHAQDVTKKTIKNSDDFIFDIETGSLSTAPCPYRIVQFSNGHTASVESKFITTIPSNENFKEYAHQYVYNGTIVLANTKLRKYKVSEEQLPLISGQVSSAYCAHLKGDENKPEITINSKGFGSWLRFVAWMQKDLIDGWWTDLPPKDNDLTIDLLTGQSY